MPLILVVMAALLTGIVPAMATGTMVCVADDKSIDLMANVTLGGLRRDTVVNLGGNLELKLGKVPAALKTIELAKDDVSQAWVDGPLVKLQLYRETTEPPNAYVLVTIETRRASEREYRGRYMLETDVADASNTFGSKPRRVTGKATCGTD